MAKYQIWNGQDDIYTPSGAHYTPQEWLAQFSWADIPGVKMIISGGIINGACAFEFNSYVENAKQQGCEILPGMTDREILDAIEEFENRSSVDITPSLEERTAAALEFLAMTNLPDEA